MRLLWIILGYYGLFRVNMGYSGLLWGFVAPFATPSQLNLLAKAKTW